MAVSLPGGSDASEVIETLVAPDAPDAPVAGGGTSGPGGSDSGVARSEAIAAPGASGRPADARGITIIPDATWPAFIALSITIDAALEASSIVLVLRWA